MEIPAWTLSTVAVLISGATAYVTIVKHRRENRELMEKEERRWSLEAMRPGEGPGDPQPEGWVVLKLVRQTQDAPRVWLNEIVVLRPRGVQVTGSAPTTGGADAEKASRRMVCAAEFMPDPSITFGPPPKIGQAPHSTFWLFARMPGRRFWRREARLEIRLRAEEITASRREIDLVLRSQLIVLKR